MASAVLVGWFLGREDAAGLLAAVSVPAGVCIGFYSWKAKAENILKYARRLDEAADGEKDVQREALSNVACPNTPAASERKRGA